MAVLDLSLVTRSIITLIEGHVLASEVWPASTSITVTPEPPDRLTGNNTLGFYLFHIDEDAYFKNIPAPGADPVPVRHTPMALNLYYQLTAHSDLTDELGPYREQLMLGCALKALHDYPIIDDDTQINGTPVLDALLRDRDNKLQIALQPLPWDEAVGFWTAGSSPLRLAVYYQVSVVKLEPDDTARRAGRVLSYGVYSFVSPTPRIDSSYNVIRFTLPGETAPRELELRPAQVPVGDVVSFFGSGFQGDYVALRLQTEWWDEPVDVDLDWGVIATAGRVMATVQPFAGSEDILPGTYTAQVIVVRQQTAPNGSTRDFEFVSNGAPFAITPTIDAIAGPGGTEFFTITGATFEHPDLDPNAVELYLGGIRLVWRPSGAPDPGQFQIQDANTITVRLPAGIEAGMHALRLIINGAESPPTWVTV